jgi:hypothetical protein
MALGVRTLAMIWDAAWAAGGGNTDHGRIDPDVLRGHYEDVNFVRSVTVDEIEDEIAHPSSGGGRGPARATSRRTAGTRRPPAKKRSAPKKKKKAAKRRR